jgi:hypothetical protein
MPRSMPTRREIFLVVLLLVSLLLWTTTNYKLAPALSLVPEAQENKPAEQPLNISVPDAVGVNELLKTTID